MAKVSSVGTPENSQPALRNPTSHRSLTSARASAPAPQRDRAPPRGALGADAARPPDSPVGGQVPFFEFFNNGRRAHVQHPRGIANATRIHGHIDDLLLDGRRLPSIGIVQEKGPRTPQATRPAPVALLAFRGRAMAHNIRSLAGGTMQHLSDHGTPTQSW